MKRATQAELQDTPVTLDFNPRPREEGDRPCTRGDVGKCHFNPRPREEGDGLRGAFFINGDISIHALVKRATLCDRETQLYSCYFNPRPREEGDRKRSLSFRCLSYFNPRPREEGDTLSWRVPQLVGNFNPRPREEGDRLV